jgi:hypothetical protein
MSALRPSKLAAGSLAALVIAACSGDSSRFTLKDRTAAELAEAPKRTAPAFLLLADTQYSVPGTDYDVSYQLASLATISVPPSLSTRAAGSFYRHSAANHVLPEVLDQILGSHAADGVRFGVFAGDLVEFACEREADEMFAVLKKHKELPLIIALGNHDAVFHGSYDTQAIADDYAGAWDRYSMRQWAHVCEHLGGPLSKPDFIKRVVEYYDLVWGFGIDKTLAKHDSEKLAEGEGGALTLRNEHGWTLYFSVKQSKPDEPDSHRQSHLWQRFEYQPERGASATFSVLDTTDYSQRVGLCQPGANFAQLGMGGAISLEQAMWFKGRPTPTENHFILSHYFPADSIEEFGACEETTGTACLWGQWIRKLENAPTFIYGHVHDEYSRQLLKDEEGSKEFDVVRVPSLIDNRAYVLFKGGEFSEINLPEDERLKSERPFANKQVKDTCEQRHRELVELERNIACFTRASCPKLESVLAGARTEGNKICKGEAQAWKNANKARWTEIEKGECKDWNPLEHWRCILRAQGRHAIDNSKMDPNQRRAFVMALLRTVKATR